MDGKSAPISGYQALWSKFMLQPATLLIPKE